MLVFIVAVTKILKEALRDMDDPSTNGPVSIGHAGKEIWFECKKCKCVFHEKPQQCPVCEEQSTDFEEVSRTETVEEFNARIAGKRSQNKNVPFCSN